MVKKNTGQFYYSPEDPTFPVVDGWTKDWFFQMTVSTTHPLKTGSRLFKALQRRGPMKGIVFVVPKKVFTNFNSFQPLVLANGKTSKSKTGPMGGWNDLAQYVVAVG
jgi:hypothetical protein